ncbi:MAG: TIGR04211 family SH3 domain-containing protein [Candidatus Obscuribacterales bacterium]|nr:TIGR04211 family SH3 domain-containing protein [Steroidobacteraceae bacterium]
MRRNFAVLSITLVLVTNARAEQLYVSDKLVVGVYPEIDSESDKISNLESGDAVEVIERAARHIRVRLSDGREGWVKANYLTPQAPAVVRLKELQGAASATSTTQLTQELAQLRDRNAALLKEIDAVKRATAVLAPTIAASETVAIATSSTPSPTIEETATEFAPRAQSSSVQWLWIAAVLVVGGAGFALGYQAFARRIRRKYGSVKII